MVIEHSRSHRWSSERTGLVLLHEPAITDHVTCGNGLEAALVLVILASIDCTGLP
jgi:hypothetical protein